MIWIKQEKEEATVTDYYMEIIGSAFKNLGHKVIYSYSLDEIHPKEEDIVVAATAVSALKLYKKCKRLVFWAQGIWPEESLMRNGSKLRFYIASWIEKRALKKAGYVFFVSETMKEFYEKKYSLCFDGRCYIMPCSNEAFHPESFQTEGKYSGNVFCYAGGISVWQCFEQTIALYKRIEEKHGNTKLLLLVKETDKALEYLQKYGVQNYEINFVPVVQLPEVLKQVKFGFVLREPLAVNYVATPTKVLTYLANGIIPIYSSCLKGMEGILRNTQYAVPYENDGDLSEIEKMLSSAIDPKEVLTEYGRIYETCYDRNAHTERIRASLRQRWQVCDQG